MNSNIKTRTVTFSYGTVKNAELLIPAEATNIVTMAALIRESYLKYMFRPGCGLMSDEVLVSSIGQSNFFAGALGGYETRMPADDFSILKEAADNDIALAVDVAKFRDPSLSTREAYRIAAKNEALSEDTRKAMIALANTDNLWNL